MTTILSIKISRSLKRKTVNVYVITFEILTLEFDKNMKTHHKSMTKENYVFESIAQKDLAIDVYATAIHVMLTYDANSILVANFEEISMKIRRNSLFDRIKQMNSFDTSYSKTIDFEYSDVFLEKYSVKDSKEKKSELSFTLRFQKEESQDSDISDS
jgi:hypothetical protein